LKIKKNKGKLPLYQRNRSEKYLECIEREPVQQ
jgi:hypothetical protein